MKKYVSMYEITKLKFEGMENYEREMNYQEWIKEMNLIENKIMEDINKQIGDAMDQKTKDMFEAKDDFKKKFKYDEFLKKAESGLTKDEKEQLEWNSLDLPLKVYLSSGNVTLYSPDMEDEIIYKLHLATDVKTGKLSIQYQGEDGSFLSHRKILKGIKLENGISKNGN